MASLKVGAEGVGLRRQQRRLADDDGVPVDDAVHTVAVDAREVFRQG